MAQEHFKNDRYVQFKATHWCRKEKWKLIPLASLTEFVNRISDPALENGQAAIWLQPRLFGENGGFQAHWMIVDVENSEDHDDIFKNLEAARNLLMRLCEMRLEEDLVIMLSGRGLRFVWPYIVPVGLEKGFIAWLKKEPEIDAAPQLHKSFFRVVGYRGHRKQGKPKNVHIHVLPSIHDLWFLNGREYLDMVKGQVPASYHRKNLIPILPRSYAPKRWADLFEDFQARERLKGSIFVPNYAFPQKRSTRKVWSQINAYLEKIGITKKEVGAEDRRVFKLSKCPVCEREGGYLTQPGRLKCFHTSCDAGHFNADDRISGLSPLAWVPNFEDFDEEVFVEDSSRNKISIADVRNRIAEAVKSKDDVLIVADPGIGKTHEMLKQLVPLCES